MTWAINQPNLSPVQYRLAIDKDTGKIIGYVFFETVDGVHPAINVTFFAVHPANQRISGPHVGTQLMQDVFEYAHFLSINKVSLETDLGEEPNINPAVKFYWNLAPHISIFGLKISKPREVPIDRKEKMRLQFTWTIQNRFDPAMGTNPTGGIDLSSNKNFFIQNNGHAIKFHLDPAMLRALQDAPGFVPVIFSIESMTNIRLWLGLD